MTKTYDDLDLVIDPETKMPQLPKNYFWIVGQGYLTIAYREPKFGQWMDCNEPSWFVDYDQKTGLLKDAIASYQEMHDWVASSIKRNERDGDAEFYKYKVILREQTRSVRTRFGRRKYVTNLVPVVRYKDRTFYAKFSSRYNKPMTVQNIQRRAEKLWVQWKNDKANVALIGNYPPKSR